MHVDIFSSENTLIHQSLILTFNIKYLYSDVTGMAVSTFPR